jgi:RND superfamily putative drug exporter
MPAVAHWCYRHRFVVIVIWAGALVCLAVVSQTMKTRYDNSFALPGTGSNSAQDLLQKAVPAQAGDSDTIVWHVSQGTVRDSVIASRMTATLNRIAGLPEVAAVASPYSPQGATQISRDGRTAYATVNFTQRADNLNNADVIRVIDTAETAGAPGLEVELGGQAIGNTEQPPLSSTSAIGIAAAAVILFLAFGSLSAMALPIVTAIAGVGGGMLAIAPLSRAITVVSFAPILMALIGLGVGVDYALFIVTRHRRGLLSGMSPEDAAVKAAGTSGRAVVFAGGTVCIALLGIFVLGVGWLTGMAVAAAVSVVFTVTAAVTLLPALLGVFKIRVLSRQQFRQLSTRGPEPAGRTTGPWAHWSRTVQRRPAVLAAAAAAVMLLMSVPVLHLRLGTSDQGNDPSSATTRRAYDLLAEGFGPGFNGPLLLVAQTQPGADRAALSQLIARLPAVAGVATVTSMPARPGATVEVVQVTPATSPQAQATSDLIVRLRDAVVPQYTRGTTLRVYVGGLTAAYNDLAAVIRAKLPWFLTAIVGLSFLLLMLAFRSLLIPATAAVMNLLAAAASFGVLTAVFGWGWGSNALGLGKPGPIDAFVPVMTLAILFGLSMDYQVFLVSRMNEEWVHTHLNGRSVGVGQTETAQVITAAAAIMICVFTAFVVMSERVVAEIGTGLTAAVALDAFILRTVLVPAAMHMFGHANWWLPRWLDRRLPHLAVEPPQTPAAPAQIPVGPPRG